MVSRIFPPYKKIKALRSINTILAEPATITKSWHSGYHQVMAQRLSPGYGTAPAPAQRSHHPP